MAWLRNMFGSGEALPGKKEGGRTLWILFLSSQFIFAAALVNLYLGMRGLMKLGGYAAAGGPYAVTHPAPGWTWVMPVSIILGLISISLAFGTGKKLGGPNIMALSFSAAFILLGLNFLEFGIRTSAGSGPDWLNILYGSVFIILGTIPLIVMILLLRTSHRERKRTGRATRVVSWGGEWGYSLVMQFAAVGLGAFLGIRFFGLIAGS